MLWDSNLGKHVSIIGLDKTKLPLLAGQAILFNDHLATSRKVHFALGLISTKISKYFFCWAIGKGI